tara:strand:+ start:1011 stop:1343 length:333 start_codon:yes stop_codon:yes gene_type:complete
MSKQFKMKGHELKGPNQRAQPGDSPLEAFSAGAAIGGAAKGAKMGMMLGPWGAAIGGLAGGIMGGIKGGKAEEAEAAAMDEETKNAVVAEKLAKDKKRQSQGYSDNQETT